MVLPGRIQGQGGTFVVFRGRQSVRVVRIVLMLGRCYPKATNSHLSRRKIYVH